MQTLNRVCFLLSLLFLTVIADIYDEVKNSRNFTGKVVLVTGSSSGIGEGTAKLFSSLGASVVVTGRNQTNVKRVAQEAQKLSPHGLKPLEVVADLTINEDVVRLINETITEFGQLDVLVNNAGSGAMSYITDTNILNEFDKLFNIDLRAPLYLSHLSVPYLKVTKGTIINISSVAGLVPGTGMMVYHMAKASLDMMTKQLAVELGSSGIRVNTINPGYIETNFGAAAGPGVPEAVIKLVETKFAALTPLKRAGLPIDIAKGVVFLASSDAQYITGANIVIDGGAIYNAPANFFDTILS